MASPSEDPPPLPDAWTGLAPPGLESLVPAFYEELKRLARSQLRGERPEHTLQTTALVHEAYVRLAGQREVSWQGRGQLLGLAAQMMRRILVNYARDRRRKKRGGGLTPVSLDAEPAAAAATVSITALDEVLHALEAIDPRQARIVEMRYFAGLTVEETATALDVSPATVKREWRFAKLWLRDAMDGRTPGAGRP